MTRQFLAKQITPNHTPVLGPRKKPIGILDFEPVVFALQAAWPVKQDSKLLCLSHSSTSSVRNVRSLAGAVCTGAAKTKRSWVPQIGKNGL